MQFLRTFYRQLPAEGCRFYLGRDVHYGPVVSDYSLLSVQTGSISYLGHCPLGVRLLLWLSWAEVSFCADCEFKHMCQSVVYSACCNQFLLQFHGLSVGAILSLCGKQFKQNTALYTKFYYKSLWEFFRW